MRRFVALGAVGLALFLAGVPGILGTARAQVPTCSPEQNPWHASSPRTVASFPAAVIPRADGTVLVCGGDKTVGGATRVCEVYDPDTDTWVSFPTEMPLAIWDPIGLELEDRTVLVCQGTNGAAESATDICYLLDDGGTPTLAADDLWETRSGPHIGGLGQQNYEMSIDPDGRILMRGGNIGGAVQCRVAVYDLVEDVWTYGDCGGQSYRANPMVPVLDRNGVVYAAGQRTSPGISEPPRRFDPTSSAWSDLALPPTRRENGLSVPGSGGGLIVGGGNVQIWDSVLYTRAAERLSGSDVWSVATPWPFFVNLYMSWTELMDPARARSLVWAYSNSIQGLGASDMMPTGFVTYLGDVDQWGLTCPMSMPASYSDGTSTVLGGLAEFWQYQNVHARAPNGRIYFLSHSQYPSYWDQHSKENALRLYWYDPNVPDRDDDAVPDCCDNCPDTFNPLQTDSNNNQLGDLCEICGDGALALAPDPRTEVIDLVALRFERSYARLGRTGGELPITLTVKTSTKIDSIAITEAIPAGATLVSAPGSNALSATNVAANSTLTIAYTIRLPEAQGFIAGQAEVTVQPLELTQEQFAIPLTLLVFRSEECDDGGTASGDGCSATCVVEEGWICSVGQPPPSYVPTTLGCLPRCGDGRRVGDEQCDDGNNVGNDGCGSRFGGAGYDNPNDYYFSVCTQRYPDMSGPEFPEYYCRGCQIELGWTCPTDGQPCQAICGDGLTRGDETCDDGNTDGGGAAGDGCDADCQITTGWACPGHYDCLRGANGESVMDLVGETPYHSPQQICGAQYFHDACMPICGDGVVAGDELCDDGNNASGDGCAGRTNTLECAMAYKAGNLPDGCLGCFAEGGYHCVGTECGTQCGDGFITSDEDCDDADTDSGDGCDASCATESGWFCGQKTVCSHGACANQHVYCYPICGDGQVLGDEQCDDHNNQDGDGCSQRDTSDFCAGALRAVADGTIGASDLPSSCVGCRNEICGDGRHQTNEGCDDGNGVAGDGCTAGCTIESGWGCSDDNQRSTCAPICGDGLLLMGEICDDGNAQSGDGCDNACHPERGYVCASGGCDPICGDGMAVAGEVCDDGNLATGDGCTAQCAVEPSWKCHGGPQRYVTLCCADFDVDLNACPIGAEGAPNGPMGPGGPGGPGGPDGPGGPAGPGSPFFGGCAETCAYCPSVFIAGVSICIASCGDDIVDPGEACDEGDAMAGDGCSAGCQVESGWTCPSGGSCAPVCGDGRVLGWEECDDSNAEGGDGCSDECESEQGWDCPEAGGACTPQCGDGLRRGGEGCDDGNERAGDGCSAECVVEPGWGCTPEGGAEGGSCFAACGNGVVDAGPQGETCDDANRTSGDGCSGACQLEVGWVCAMPGVVCAAVCGDGRIVGGERCDDGNAAGADGCDGGCQPEYGWRCAEAGTACAPICGDGVVRGAEVCDDGDAHPGDGCDAGCGIEAGWACPEGGGGCTKSCGNGVMDANEVCDDGNVTTGDGCSSGCRLEAGYVCPAVGVICRTTCGDGIVAGSERCDDGGGDSPTSGDGCSSGCLPEHGWTCPAAGGACTAVCGDGVVRGDEACDDGDQIAGNGCDANCATEDGYLCPPAGGPCESTCGNGVLDDFEECDDANATGGDGCDAQCQEEDGFACTTAGEACAPICGDGFQRMPEHCDDGNLTARDGCSETCQVEAGWECPIENQACRARCGDGIVVGGETCDDGEVAAVGDGDESGGDQDGCSATCQVEPGWECPTPGAPCVRAPVCGNEVLEHGEACDDGNGESGDGCSATCRIEVIVPVPDAVCGNAKVEVGEACDDGNTANGDTCNATCTTVTTPAAVVASGGAGCAGGAGDSGIAAGLVLALGALGAIARRRRARRREE